MSASAALRLGTRRSPLALFQAHAVRDAIHAVEPDRAVELVEIVSDGDRDPRELRVIGERGIFAHALERELAAGTIDAAVHSSKDLELEATPGTVLAAWLPRADPRDALVGSSVELLELPQGATIATGSARRMAALRTIRPDLKPVPIRGNVRGRIDRAAQRGDAGCMLAMAGLTRLGITDDPSVDVRPIAVDVVVPEAGQGAVVVQAPARSCPRTGFDWSRIDDLATRRTVQLERELTLLLGGGCEHPVGVHVELDRGVVHAFAAPSPERAGVTISHELLGLELGTLVGARDAEDADEAAAWTARELLPALRAALASSSNEVDA